MHLGGAVGEGVNANLAQVEQELCGVFLHLRDHRELVLDLVDLDGGDGGAANAAEQDTAERVAGGVGHAAGERLHEDAGVVILLCLDDEFG